MPIPLQARTKNRFCLTLRIVARGSPIAVATPPTDPDITLMSPPSIPTPVEARPGDRGESGRGGHGERAVFGVGDDRLGERVLAVGLRGRHQGRQLVRAPRAGGLNIGESGLARSDGAVLSSAMVPSLCAVSRASAEPMRVPAWAALPV